MLGLWDKIDAIWFMAAHDQAEAKLNWKEDAHNLTEINSPTWTEDEGFTGNGSSMWLNSNFNPMDGINYTLNSASIGIYSRTDANNDNYNEIGAWEFPTDQSILACRRTAGGSLLQINNNSSIQPTVSSSIGLFVGNRLSNTNLEIFQNGSSVGNDNSKSVTGIPDVNFGILVTNATEIGPMNYSIRQMSVAIIGASISNQGDLFVCIEAYMDALGKGVVAGTTAFPYESLKARILPAMVHLKSLKPF